jgi:hypothetical protein
MTVKHLLELRQRTVSYTVTEYDNLLFADVIVKSEVFCMEDLYMFLFSEVCICHILRF